MATIFTEPRDPNNAQALTSLNESPIPALQAPAPSGVGAAFKPSDVKHSMAAQLAEFLGKNDIATSEVASTAAFTRDELERKNQEAIKAWVAGPTFPTGDSSGKGANTLQPFVNAFFNRERLNAGTPVRPELGNPYQRGLGNAWGDKVNSSNWAALTHSMTQTATVDPEGFAQVNHTGNFIADRDTTYQPERGGLNGGPLSGIGYGGINAGAVYSKQDGAAGGAVGYALLESGAGQNPYAFAPPSGAGDLATTKAYGTRAQLPP